MREKWKLSKSLKRLSKLGFKDWFKKAQNFQHLSTKRIHSPCL
jgi:hypothetical protein